MRYLFESLDLWLHVFTLESDESAFVSHLVAIIRGRKHCKALSALLIFITLWFDFMRSYHEFYKLK